MIDYAEVFAVIAYSATPSTALEAFVEQEREAAVQSVNERVRAAIRLVSPDGITPDAARVVLAVLDE